MTTSLLKGMGLALAAFLFVGCHHRPLTLTIKDTVTPDDPDVRACVESAVKLPKTCHVSDVLTVANKGLFNITAGDGTQCAWSCGEAPEGRLWRVQHGPWYLDDILSVVKD